MFFLAFKSECDAHGDDDGDGAVYGDVVKEITGIIDIYKIHL